MRLHALTSNCTTRSSDVPSPLLRPRETPARRLRDRRVERAARRSSRAEVQVRPRRAAERRRGIRRLHGRRRCGEGRARRHAQPLRSDARGRCSRGVRDRVRASGEEAVAMARIEDYAIIGDLETAALVERGGSIDWLCFPRFDSGACFAALLGDPDNGRWLLAPTAGGTTSRRYRGDTLILETTWENDDGAVRVYDFMPPRDEAPDVVRIVEGIRGKVEMRSELTIRFDYGHIVPWVRRVDEARVAVAGPDGICFRTSAKTRGENMRTVSTFTVEKGERVPFVLTWFPSHGDLPPHGDAEDKLAATDAFWREWMSGCHAELPDEWRDVIVRSLIVLKALVYDPTGGIVAAPTTSR